MVHFCLYHHISNWVVVVIGRNISNRKLSICVERDHVFTQQRATWWLYNIIRINLLKCCNCCCSCFQKRNVDCHVTSICSLLFLTCRVARARHRRAFICWEKREATNIASTHLGCCWTAHHVAFHLARSSLHAFTHVPAIAVQRCCTCLDTVRVVAHVARGTETRWQRNICIVKKKKNLIDDKTSSQLGVIDILVYYIENIIQLYMVIQRKILGLDLCIQSSSSSSDDWKWSGARPSQQRPPTAAHYSEKYISNIITGNSLYYASSSNGFLFQERAASFFSHFQNWIYSIIYIDFFF